MRVVLILCSTLMFSHCQKVTNAITTKKGAQHFTYDWAHPICNKISSYLSHHKYTKADSLIDLTFKAPPRGLTSQDTALLILYNVFTSARNKNFDKADSLLTRINHKILEKSHALQSELGYTKGYLSYQNNNYQLAIKHYKKALSTLAKIDKRPTITSAKYLNQLAIVYLFGLENYPRADSLHKEVYNIYEKYSAVFPYGEATTAYFLSISNRTLSNYQQSENYIKAAMDFFEQEKDTYMLTFAYGEYANLLQYDIRNKAKVIDIYNRTIEQAKSLGREDLVFLNLVNKGVRQTILNNLNKAEFTLRNALTYGQNKADSIYVLNKLANTHIKAKKLIKAEKVLQLLKELLSYKGASKYDQVEYLMTIAELNSHNGELHNAIDKCNLAIQLTQPSSESAYWESNKFDKINIKFSQRLLELLTKKALFLQDLSSRSNNSEHYLLTNKLYNYIFRLLSIHDIYIEKGTEEHALSLLKTNYINGILNNIKSARALSDTTFYDIAFELMFNLKENSRINKSYLAKTSFESSRYQTLLDKMQLLSAQILDEEIQQNKSLPLLQNLYLKKDSLRRTINNLEITRAKSGIFQESKRKLQVKKWLKQNNSSLFSFVSAKDVLITYYFDPSTHYEKWTILHDPTLLKELKDYRDAPYSKSNTDNILNLNTLSKKIGHKLFYHYFKDTIPENLVVIGEGLIENISIETLSLPQSSNVSSSQSWKNYWLINNINIAHVRSFSRLLKIQDMAEPLQLDDVKASIFSYASSPKSELKNSYYEGRYLKGILPKSTKWYKGASAKKSTFTRVYKNSDVIHLALHGTTDNFNENSSAIIFPGKNNVQETFYKREILQLKGRPRLLFLNICNSNDGVIIDGEGTLSLGKDFEAVGARNLIVLSSTIGDATTSRFSRKFYKQLKVTNNIIRSYRSTFEHLLDKENITSLMKYRYYL